ncbi:YeeE/YedE family protein [soil metagenome]
MTAGLTAAYAGVVFAFGLVVSGMTDPHRITAFLAVGGHWDPTLAFVMIGAIGVHAPLAYVIRRRRRPVFEPVLHLPQRANFDVPLIVGAAVFGVGWGLSGYCPGPALVSLGTAAMPAIVFIGAMIGGIAITRLAQRR